ncbi:MAG: type II/IV secretion system protein, partial [Deltaproteobacteria bacterium]
TTTLYSTLEEINSPHNKILSAEDPIEYNLDYVNQKQVSKNFGFADLARAFLRQDPDILLIGEIRDEETADIAIKAAQTGHLILSTLHTNDSVSAVSRLRSLGIHPNMLSSALLGVLSQRLVRRICPHCIAPYEPDPKLRTLFAPKLKKERFYAGKGCDHCNYSGYKGRIGIFELFVVDPEIQRLIREDRSVEEIQEAALEQGMVPIVADALHKITRDITTMEEVVRVVPYMQIQSQLKVATLDPLSEETPSSKG